MTTQQQESDTEADFWTINGESIELITSTMSDMKKSSHGQWGLLCDFTDKRKKENTLQYWHLADWEGGIIPDCEKCGNKFAEDGHNYNERDGDEICDDCDEELDAKDKFCLPDRCDAAGKCSSDNCYYDLLWEKRN